MCSLGRGGAELVWKALKFLHLECCCPILLNVDSLEGKKKIAC
jgi:hypothetical protein